MAFVSRLCGPIALLFFVATFNLSYSFAVRNGQQSTGDMDQAPSSAQSLVFSELNANQTDLTPGGDGLRAQLFQKAMEILEKEERVYDLEAEKLELEIEVLKKELSGNETVEESQSEVNETLQESTTTMSTEPSTETSTEPSTEASTEPSTEATTVAASTAVFVMTEVDNNTLTSTPENVALVEEQAFTDAFIATHSLPASTTQEPSSSTAVVKATTIVVHQNGTRSFEFLKSAGEPIKTSINAVALSLLATVVVLKF